MRSRENSEDSTGESSGESADVIVVGAGPAGSSAAAHLAAAGLDVLVLEKSAFPRDKVCGDGLTRGRCASSRTWASPKAARAPMAGPAPAA